MTYLQLILRYHLVLTLIMKIIRNKLNLKCNIRKYYIHRAGFVPRKSAESIIVCLAGPSVYDSASFYYTFFTGKYCPI